jgi:hypothetical protein
MPNCLAVIPRSPPSRKPRHRQKARPHLAARLSPRAAARNAATLDTASATIDPLPNQHLGIELQKFPHINAFVTKSRLTAI